jgi:integrase
LRLEDFQLREGHWVIADLRGKGGHIRTIPVPEWVKQAVDGWTFSANITSGPLLRSINKAGRIWGKGFTPKVIWAVVKTNAKSCGLPTLAPHDLRSYSACGMSGEAVRNCATKQEANWSRSNSCLATFRCKPPSVTWDANNVFAMQ